MMSRVVALSAGFLLALASAMGLAVAGTPNLAEAWNGPAIAWKDLKSGIPEATRSGKTVVMVFHAPWCTACRTYRNVFKDPRVVEASKDLVMILIDADADKTANGAFAPDGTYVPRTIFMTPEGDVRTDLTGKTDPEHPHTIDIEKPDELLALMEKAGGGDGQEAPKTDQRAGL